MKRVAGALLIAALGVQTATRAEGSLRLPDHVPPVVAAWFWGEPEFAPEGYKPFLDLVARHSGVNVLMTSLRAPLMEVTDPAVRAHIAEAAAYAREHGMKVVMDLDVRLAREAFRAAHPDELQEMLRLREVPLAETGEAVLRIASEHLSDHYTHRTTPYAALSGRLVRVYSYVRGEAGIDPDTVRDITGDCTVTAADEREVAVSIPCGPDSAGRTACVMAAFTHLTPDVFAPHLAGFERGILLSYADTGIAGACKDEWGFPPNFDGCPAKDDYWFSRFRAEAYQARTGRDLMRDCLLMTYGEAGRERERQAAVNMFLRMSTERNGALEQAFHDAVKEAFGPDGIVATHPTWYPYPGLREFKKNGLHWWIAPRGLAQTDEVTPYAVRTSLAKKWGSGVWYNMFYSSDAADYRAEVWAHALGGGRIDYHPVYPMPEGQPHLRRYEALLDDGLMRGDCRVRLLNFISRAPLDCPVAVVFGHACAMNWAGPAYDDVGIGLTNALWRAGYPADLIPSSEIHNGSLRVDEAGAVRYGPQRYRAVVLYHPEFEPAETAAFFDRVDPAETALYRAGGWTRDFEARDLDGDAVLPAAMSELEGPETLIAKLEALNVPAQTPATRTMAAFGRTSAAPGTAGRCRLLDGTVIEIAGSGNPAGDPLNTELLPGVTVEAEGIAAARLREDGALDAMAAGGLRRFEGGGVHIALPAPADVALWRENGEWRGVIQGWDGPLPEALTRITDQWLRLALPRELSRSRD